MRKSKTIGCIAAFATVAILSSGASAAERNTKVTGRYQIIAVSTGGAFSSECLDDGARALTDKVNDALSKGANPIGGVSIAVNPTTNTCMHAQAVLWPENRK